MLSERQAAVSAVLKSGHIPAGMELFTAADKSQMKTIEKWIDESDVYMLILGGRYGSIEPVTQLSYTELEYDYAVSQGKPTFAVVIRLEALENKIKSLGSEVIERVNPKALEQFRTKVLRNISSFYSDEKDVKLCVYESISDYASQPQLKGWISGNEVQDTIALNEEIKKLREENYFFNQEVSRLKLAAVEKPSSAKIKEKDLIELVAVLQKTEITIPAKAMGEKTDHKSNLMSVLLNNKERLVGGVTNQYGIDDAESFLYFSVMPKLQIHDLAVSEKVVGVTYRRCVLSKKGIDLLAYIERKIVLNKKKTA